MLKFFVELFAQVFLYAVCALTGHCIVWCLTLGTVKWAGTNDDAALFVGGVFWVTVGLGVWLAFSR